MSRHQHSEVADLGLSSDGWRPETADHGSPSRHRCPEVKDLSLPSKDWSSELADLERSSDHRRLEAANLDLLSVSSPHKSPWGPCVCFQPAPTDILLASVPNFGTLYLAQVAILLFGNNDRMKSPTTQGLHDETTWFPNQNYQEVYKEDESQ
jgi:hypothetical protein